MYITCFFSVLRKRLLFSSLCLLVLIVCHLLWPLHFKRNILQVTLIKMALIFPQKWKSFASIAYHTAVDTFNPITMLNSCFNCASITGVVGVLFCLWATILYSRGVKLTSASRPRSWNLIPQGPGQWRRQERGMGGGVVCTKWQLMWPFEMWHSPYLLCGQFLNSIWHQDSNTISIHISRMKSRCISWNTELLFHGYVSKHSEHMRCLIKKWLRPVKSV